MKQGSHIMLQRLVRSTVSTEPRPPKRRLGFLPRLQQGFVGPLRREGRVGVVLVEKLDSIKSHARRLAQERVKNLQDLCGLSPRHGYDSSISQSMDRRPINPHTT